jgi:hypothetical protein
MGLWEDYYDQGRAYASFYCTLWHCLYILICEWISARCPQRKSFRGETILITGECIPRRVVMFLGFQGALMPCGAAPWLSAGGASGIGRLIALKVGMKSSRPP